MDFESKIFNKLHKNRAKPVIIDYKIENADYFHCNIKDKNNFMKSRIEFMKQSFLDVLVISEFKPITHIDSKPFYTLGMISSTNGDKISEICYLSDSIDGFDVSIQLDLNNLEEYSLFNWQIVALRCTNTKSYISNVEKIYMLPTLNINNNHKSNIKATAFRRPFNKTYIQSIFDHDYIIIILFGPFIDESYECFNEFIEEINVNLRKNMFQEFYLFLLLMTIISWLFFHNQILIVILKV